MGIFYWGVNVDSYVDQQVIQHPQAAQKAFLAEQF